MKDARMTDGKTLNELIEEVDDIRRVVISKFEERLNELKKIAEEKGVVEFGFKEDYSGEEPICNEPYDGNYESEEEYDEAYNRYEESEEFRICFDWMGEYQTNFIFGYVFKLEGDRVVFTGVKFCEGYDAEEPEYVCDGYFMFDPSFNGNWLQCVRIIEIIEKELGLA